MRHEGQGRGVQRPRRRALVAGPAEVPHQPPLLGVIGSLGSVQDPRQAGQEADPLARVPDETVRLVDELRQVRVALGELEDVLQVGDRLLRPAPELVVEGEVEATDRAVLVHTSPLQPQLQVAQRVAHLSSLGKRIAQLDVEHPDVAELQSLATERDRLLLPPQLAQQLGEAPTTDEPARVQRDVLTVGVLGLLQLAPLLVQDGAREAELREVVAPLLLGQLLQARLGLFELLPRAQRLGEHDQDVGGATRGQLPAELALGLCDAMQVEQGRPEVGGCALERGAQLQGRPPRLHRRFEIPEGLVGQSQCDVGVRVLGLQSQRGARRSQGLVAPAQAAECLGERDVLHRAARCELHAPTRGVQGVVEVLLGSALPVSERIRQRGPGARQLRIQAQRLTSGDEGLLVLTQLQEGCAEPRVQARHVRPECEGLHVGPAPLLEASSMAVPHTEVAEGHGMLGVELECSLVGLLRLVPRAGIAECDPVVVPDRGVVRYQTQRLGGHGEGLLVASEELVGVRQVRVGAGQVRSQGDSRRGVIERTFQLCRVVRSRGRGQERVHPEVVGSPQQPALQQGCPLRQTRLAVQLPQGDREDVGRRTGEIHACRVGGEGRERLAVSRLDAVTYPIPHGIRIQCAGAGQDRLPRCLETLGVGPANRGPPVERGCDLREDVPVARAHTVREGARIVRDGIESARGERLLVLAIGATLVEPLPATEVDLVELVHEGAGLLPAPCLRALRLDVGRQLLDARDGLRLEVGGHAARLRQVARALGRAERFRELPLPVEVRRLEERPLHRRPGRVGPLVPARVDEPERSGAEHDGQTRGDGAEAQLLLRAPLPRSPLASALEPRGLLDGLDLGALGTLVGAGHPVADRRGDDAGVGRPVAGHRLEATPRERLHVLVGVARGEPLERRLEPGLRRLHEQVAQLSQVRRLAGQDLAQDRAEANTSERSSSSSTWPSACSGGM